MTRRTQRATRTDTLLPDTTLFRSGSAPTVLQADRARMQSRALASAWRCMGVSRGGRAGERPGRGNGVTESTQAAPGSCPRRAPFARKGGVAYDAARWGAGKAQIGRAHV